MRANDIFKCLGISRESGRITVLSGGFPCQPHSVSGSRQGSLDERDLWPQYRRLIRDIRPVWVVAENVRGLLSSNDGRLFGDVLRDLADLGYDAGWCMFPASAFGAVHERQRVFTIAHADSERRDCMDASEEIRSEDHYTKTFDEWLTRQADLPLDVAGYITDAGGGPERDDTGLPAGLDRLRCIGNSVCPHQAYPIFKAIIDIEKRKEQV